MCLYTGIEREEAGPEAQVYHEVLFGTDVVTAAAAHLLRHLDTGLHHLLKEKGPHVASLHLLEAGALMSVGLQPHRLQEGLAGQGQSQNHYQSQDQGLGHFLEARLVRKV